MTTTDVSEHVAAIMDETIHLSRPAAIEVAFLRGRIDAREDMIAQLTQTHEDDDAS